MDEVNNNYKCHICNMDGMIHEAWKEHNSSDEHHEKVSKLIRKKYYCKKCDYQFEDQRRYDRHCESNKHRFGQLTLDELYCHKCNTQCSNKAKWDDHIKTKKHLSNDVKKTEEELFCSKCNTQCHNDSEWEKHIQTKKHNTDRNQERFCEACKCTQMTDHAWKIHLKTAKHIRNTITNGETVSESVQQTSSEDSESNQFRYA